MDTLKNHDEEVIIITSFISIQPDCISAFLGIAKEIIEATSNEPGCIEYRFLQDPFCPEIFFFYEVYKNKESQIFHSGQDYLKKIQEPAEANATTEAHTENLPRNPMLILHIAATHKTNTFRNVCNVAIAASQNGWYDKCKIQDIWILWTKVEC